MFFKSNDSLPHFYKPKNIIADRKYAQTRVTYSLLKKALDNEITNNYTNPLNTRMVNNEYAVPILNSLQNVFYYEDTFFVPNSDETLDVKLRKNAQNCLKILLDFTNLTYKDIFKMLTDENKSKMWITNNTIEAERDCISVACHALGLDKIFKKGMFRGLKAKLEKLQGLKNKTYEQKATLFSRLVECNKELQSLIFGELGSKPCKYSEKFDTRFAAKQSEKRTKVEAVTSVPPTQTPKSEAPKIEKSATTIATM